MNLRPSWFSSRAEWDPDICCSPSEPASISRDHLSLDRPIVFESHVCQLPQTVSQLSWFPFLSVSSAPSAFPSSFLRNRRGADRIFILCTSSLQGFSSSPVSSFGSVFTVCSTSVSLISTAMSTSLLCKSVVFSRLRFTGSSGSETGVAGRFGDFVINRFLTGTFSCVSVRFSPLLELDGPGAFLVSTGSPCISSFSSCWLFLRILRRFWWFTRKSEGFSAAGGISGIVVFGLCGVSTTARRFSCDQL